MNKPDQKTLNSPEALNRAYIAPEVVRQRQRTLEALDIKAGEKILDIGCGTGFLTQDMALIVGPQGQVTSIDSDKSMVQATLDRCHGLNHVSGKVGNINDLELQDNQFDVATCTQVLLYVADVTGALTEIHNVVKPGGRIAVLETDWRGLVTSSSYPELTRKITDGWDATVASPNLPSRLFKLIRQQGFHAIRCEAIPLLNTSFSPNSFSVNSIEWLAKSALKQETISKQEGIDWCENLFQQGKNNEYFFCLNRFLFTAVK